ncbi:calponin homology domain-containing protein DDB_G0272472-like [Rhopilema esculentum]|uniref:calponin homology domain-containing protein DDB_G0272472-like n=1 Tax=Rhopilema esculentum TaxID=499914 RepID=UPI0031DD3A2D
MTWTLEHDTLLCREILVEEPYLFKMGTRERGHSWDNVANNLNRIGQPHFMVDQRAVRDRFLKLERSFKRKMAEEERASGISPPEPTELEQAVQDIIERGTEAQAVMLRVGGKVDEKEKETAESIRKRSMERLAETRERESQEGGKKRKKTVWDKDTEVMHYMREKTEREAELKREEFELRRREIEIKEKEIKIKEREMEREWEIKHRELEIKEKNYEARVKRDTEMMAMFQQQQGQMQHQNQLLLDVVNKLLEKS